MKSVFNFGLLFIGLCVLAQQAAFSPNTPFWMLPYYPFNSQPYPFFHGQKPGFTVADFSSQKGYPSSSKSTEGNYGLRNLYPAYYFDNEAHLKNVGQFRSQPSQDQTVNIGSDIFNVNPLSNERKSTQNAYNPLGRFFLESGVTVGGGAASNYLIKTSFVFVTSTGTLCFVKSCIPKSKFDLNSETVICARRKRDAEILHDFNISPSSVDMVEPTAASTLREIKFNNAPISHEETSPIVLISSLLEDPLRDTSRVPINSITYERQKRFLFALTTTFTSYSFISSTYTSTILLAADSDLICRPADVVLC